MVKYGKQFVCNRCGKEKFVQYETEMPAGWIRLSYNNELCPICADLYNNMLNNFFAPEVKREINLDS